MKKLTNVSFKENKENKTSKNTLAKLCYVKVNSAEHHHLSCKHQYGYKVNKFLYDSEPLPLVTQALDFKQDVYHRMKAGFYNSILNYILT